MNIRVGDFVSESTSETASAARETSSAIVLIDDSSHEVTLFVPPYQAVNIKEAQRVLVGLNGSEISKYVKSGTNPLVTEATVWSVSPSVSLQNRAVEVKVRTTGPSTFLSDGDFVSAWIATSTKDDAVRVPYTALIDQDRKLFTFVVSEDGQSVEKRQIDAGIEGLSYLEALSGVGVSEKIVTRGQHLLATGSPIRIIEEGN
jgi:multidrug efflux pump subunit AcrA (membrane-fusion protein)